VGGIPTVIVLENPLPSRDAAPAAITSMTWFWSLIVRTSGPRSRRAAIPSHDGTQICSLYFSFAAAFEARKRSG
jgi:hypothetical protein